MTLNANEVGGVGRFAVKSPVDMRPVRSRLVRFMVGVVIIGLAYYVITRVVVSIVLHYPFERS